ncbi:MAG: HAMP domain-containing histidine kinase [Bdellovibrionales bacterium]|nr:HAMP domain-containing histidine kinase [Bdellovibrionales bacterium]
MIFLSLGICLSVLLITIFFQYQQLRFDLRTIKRFVGESTKNVLVLEQPIMMQRSISEFWKAFEGRPSAIIGLDVYFDESLVSQNGSGAESNSFFVSEVKECFLSTSQKVCVHYFISPLLYFTVGLWLLFAVIFSAIVMYLIRIKTSERTVDSLARPLELEVERIFLLSDRFKANVLAPAANDVFLDTKDIPIQEVAQLSAAYNELLKHRDNYLQLEIQNEVSSSLNSMAAQVAHDIRSPLSALNIVMTQLPDMPKEQDDLIRNAIKRINDIANSLLERGKGMQAAQIIDRDSHRKSDIIILNPVVNALVLEKKALFKEINNLDITLDVTSALVRVKFNATELTRILSNLINNSIEAIEPMGGRITISLREQNSWVTLVVADDGKGMPDHVRKKLMAGEKGVSFGKAGTSSGSGIGIYHAKLTVESFGGRFEISSQENVGTMIMISLPKQQI